MADSVPLEQKASFFLPVGIKQQRSMVQDTTARDLLRAAGDLFPIHRDIAGTVFARRDAERVQRPYNRLQTAVVVKQALLVGYERIVEISQVMVDRPTAGHAAHNGVPRSRSARICTSRQIF